MTDSQLRAMSFGAIAEDYDGLRPEAPQEAVDWLVPAGCEVAVDVGAGTGLFTRRLVDRGAQVVAVEPDPRMRRVLTARSPGVRVMAGRGESIPLPDAAADGVFVSTAWHWMDHKQAVPEAGRVLRDGGRLGLVWTSRDREVDWLRDLNALRSQDASEPESGERFRRRLDFELPEPPIFHNIARATFEFVRTMTWRTSSRCSAPTAGPSSRLRRTARRDWPTRVTPWRRGSRVRTRSTYRCGRGAGVRIG